jgi:hypothetical protein
MTLPTLLMVALLSQAPAEQKVAPAPVNLPRARAWIPALSGAVFLAGGISAAAISKYEEASAEEPGISGATRNVRHHQAHANMVGAVALGAFGLCLFGVAAFMYWFEDGVLAALTLTTF